MNPDFQYREITCATKDIEILEDIMKRNCNVISAALDVAINQNLFATVTGNLKASFIVQECERIISGGTRPKGDMLKTFEFRRTPRETP